MATGGTLSDKVDETAQSTAKHVGLCRGLFYAFKIEFPEIEEEKDNINARSEQT